MAKSFVRATGACSAPPPKSIDDSIANMGKMRMKLIGGVEYAQPNLAQLKIKHPNITGLQPMKIGSRVRPPAHFVSQLKISYEGAPVMAARLTFSISMDPSLRFFFVPSGPGRADRRRHRHQKRLLVFPVPSAPGARLTPGTAAAKGA